MKKEKLEPIYGKTRKEASYEKIMFEMLSKLTEEIRINNHLRRDPNQEVMQHSSSDFYHR